jgi:uncharacterized lipoprotein YmbA
MRRNVTTATLVMAMVTLAGCSLTSGSDPARFYVLAPLDDTEIEAASGGAVRPGLIGVGPVQFPDYLNRPQMVTRVGPNQLEILEHDRWAEPLAKGFARTLANDLALLLGADEIVVAPWHEASAPDYAAKVDVLRFERDATGAVTLQCRWTLVSTGDGERVAGGEVTITEPAETPDVSGSVAAMSRVTGNLSREIAEAVPARD